MCHCVRSDSAPIPCQQTFYTEDELACLNALEKVSMVALAALSLYACWELFIPFFLIGCAIGVYRQFEDCGTHNAPSCTQGILEQITGIKLPPPIGLISNVAITACHAFSHATIFAPIIGIYVGTCAGKTFSELQQSC